MLSDEERQRIYEEEKARREAQNRIQQEQDRAKKAEARRKGRRLGIAVFILLAVAWGVSSLSGSKEKQSTRILPARDVSTLKTGRAVCVSKALLEELAAHQQDVQAVERLLQSGCLFTEGAMLVSVLAVEPSGIANVRVFTGKKQDIELWTSFDSLEK